MNAMTKTAVPILVQRADLASCILGVSGPRDLFIRAGTIVTVGGERRAFETDTPVETVELVAGQDYGIGLAPDTGAPVVLPIGWGVLDDGRTCAGFHFAPGGNAVAREGGDREPVINPHSCWDIGFRPACPDPRGMTRVVLPGGKSFWADIYLTAADHLDFGTTSKFGATIADGRSQPQKADGKRYRDFDYEVAEEVMDLHGKRLLGAEEFFAAAYGVTERASLDADPEKTGRSGSRLTSKWGLVDATGSMWQWGTDGDPDSPRASLFGGSWLSGSDAGSRYADLDCWAGSSHGGVGARGASDHLSPE